MRIKKISQPLKVESQVIDSLDSNSTTNAPSIHAVNEALKEVYSTEETIVGTWLGKPLYRKCLGNMGEVLVEGTKILNVSDLNIDIITDFKGYINYEGGYIGPLYRNIYFLSIDKKSITYYANSLGITNGTMVIEYTKTTD